MRQGVVLCNLILTAALPALIGCDHQASRLAVEHGQWHKRLDAISSLDIFDAAIELNSENAQAFAHRSELRLYLGRTDEALADFARAEELDPDCEFPAGCYNAIGWTRATSVEAKYRDGHEAIRLALQACEATDYGDFAYVDTLAAAYAEAGDFEQAVHWQERALKLAPRRFKREFQERLFLFRERKPYRQ